VQPLFLVVDQPRAIRRPCRRRCRGFDGCH
jgi:hypothetical protein